MLTGTLVKNQEVRLDIGDSARRRVVCGLRWDPMNDAADHASKRGSYSDGSRFDVHDLDLLCITFDTQGRFAGLITGAEGERTGDSGNIYHTGDVVEGQDDDDDEQIMVELFNLSGKIGTVFFVARVASAHNFGHVQGAAIRIANAADRRNFAITPVGVVDGSDKNAFVFGCLARKRGTWIFRYIGEYFEGGQELDWASVLAPHAAADAQSQPNAGAAPAFDRPQKGQSVPLHYTRAGRQRVVCGLSWDPPAAAKAAPVDMDLACVIYDADGKAVDGVSGGAGETIDNSGAIYHSGDDKSGQGDRDDEAISVEMASLPDYAHHIVFIGEIQSGQVFGELRNPSMRLADGKSETDQLAVAMTAREGADKNAYVFARISRRPEGWILTWIDEYVDGRAVEDWTGHLTRYLG